MSPSAETSEPPRISGGSLGDRMIQTCANCSSPVVLGPFETSCPICAAPVRASGHGERRARDTVPFVRDWITQLRLSGGDFTKAAARQANEVANAAFRRGIPMAEIFDLSRAAYYEALRPASRPVTSPRGRGARTTLRGAARSLRSNISPIADTA